MLAACEPAASAVEPPPPHWVYAPGPPAWLGDATDGQLGRSQPPQVAPSLGITGAGAPLHLATPWTVPGEGPARAALYGTAAGAAVIQLIDVDRGAVLWEDRVGCGAPIVGVTAEAIVCSDVHGIRAIGLDGKPRWHVEATFVAMTDDHVVTVGEGGAVVLDAATGTELRRVALPPAIAADSVIASCGDAGAELFAVGRDGKLVRIADAVGGPAVAWAAALGNVTAIEACSGGSVIATVAAPGAEPALVAIDRKTGAITGRITGVRGSWPARDDSDRLEVATATGVARWPRTLAGEPVVLDLPPLGELLARRGDRRLVRASPLTAVVLDRGGVRAYVALASMGAVLGDRAIVAASWTGSSSELVERFALPARYAPRLRLPARRGGVVVPAELRDLPAAVPATGARVAAPDLSADTVAAVAIDPYEPEALYVVTLAPAGDAAPAVGLARFSLGARAWRWQRAGACGHADAVSLAFARDAIVCGAGTQVFGIARDGSARWTIAVGGSDRVAAAGGVAIVAAADRAVVVEAATGTLLGALAGDGGAAVAAVPIELAGAPGALVIAAEHGRLVAHLPAAGMLPLWTLAIRGTVRSLSGAGDGVIVELEDGDVYRVDGATGRAAAIADSGLVWHVDHELVTGQGDDAGAWQYALFELGGAIRVRNDYALTPPISPVTAAARGPAGSPLLVVSGPGLRDLLILDPRTGSPTRRLHMPDDDPAPLVFSSSVAGVGGDGRAPVVGAVLAQPLRIVVF